MRRIKHAALALAFIHLVTLPVLAQPSQTHAWPQRTVRLITPNTIGNGGDLTARLFAERLAERWGRPVIVENRPGADGILAVTGFLGSRDDHTLLFSFAGIITINPLIHNTLPYDPVSDLVPIASASESVTGVAVPATMKVNSLEDFVKIVRPQPGKLTWAATAGLPYYIFAALLQTANLQMVQAPYRDFAPALSDLSEGRIHAVATGLGLLAPLAQTGKIKILAVANRERSPLVPDVTTAQEAGYPQLTFEGVVGFYGARDMPTDRKDRIAADVRAVAADPAVAERLASTGSVLRVGTPAEFAAAIEEQRVKIAAIARVTGIVRPTR
jgi:tripartite-type tricarboxylate transporter receptor subunit TctC